MKSFENFRIKLVVNNSGSFPVQGESLREELKDSEVCTPALDMDNIR